MANHCENAAVLIPETPVAKLLWPTLLKCFEDNTWAATLIPGPEKLIEEEQHGWFSIKDYDARVAARTHAEEYNLAVYKAADYHSWRRANWGTTWVDDTTVTTMEQRWGTEIYLHFTSADTPPLKVYEQLHRLGFTVHAEYAEFGMCLGGIYHLGARIIHQYTNQLQDPNDLVRQALERNEWSISEWYDIEDEDE
jgi:hypothetical protein